MKFFNQNLYPLLLIICVLFLDPLSTFSAEVLQVNSSNILLIGDQNRSYSVGIPCLNINSENESEIKDWLKFNLPRRTRVNLKPLGSKDGVLIANINLIGQDLSISELISNNGLADYTCSE